VLSHHQGKWHKTMEITAGLDLYHTCINNGILYKILITGVPRLSCNPLFCTQLTNKHFKLSHIGAVKLTPKCILCLLNDRKTSPSGRAVKGVGLRPLTCCDCGFESHAGHGYFSCHCCVLSGRGLCNRPITRPEEFYQVWCV